MKSILISIRPEWVEKIANGIKSIEIRTSAPKDWRDYLSGKTKVEPKPRTAFIYCTKGKPLTRLGTLWNGDRKTDVFSLSYPPNDTYNGKVVGKFRLGKVDCLRFGWEHNLYFGGIGSATRLSIEETKEYLNGKIGYLWYISELETFDEPKPLSEFGLKRAPQSWRYVEVEK